MKNQFLALSFLGAFLFLTSCNKDDDNAGNGGKEQLNERTAQFNDDANNYKSESDQADNDMNQSLRDAPGFGKTSITHDDTPPCGMTMDDSTEISNKIVYFHFDGNTSCYSPYRTRSGIIKVQLTSGNSWNDEGAVLTITYIHFKVSRLNDNASIEFNGTKTLKNVNGHNWIAFFAGTKTYKYKERAMNIQLTYNNGETAVWNSARVTEWSFNPVTITEGIKFTATGDTTINGYSHTDSWGTDRFENGFIINYDMPWVSNTHCELRKPISGQLECHLQNGNYGLTLGVDQNGVLTKLECAYGYKVSWTSNKGSFSTNVFAYK